MFMRNRKRCLRTGVLLALFIGGSEVEAAAQDFLPRPAVDHSLVYFLNDRNDLVPLPFEQGQTSLKLNAPAKETRIGFIELKGEHALTIFDTDMPRIFLFTAQRAGSHPPFLVFLTARRGSRRVTAVAQQGLKGFAIASEEIVKPLLRVIATAGEEVFVEVRPRISLMAGEYAIIGNDLARIATFRIVAAKR
jgi:hypothetical protein